MSGYTNGALRAGIMAMDGKTWQALNGGEMHIVQRNQDVVAVVWDADDRGETEEVANARLFAAAPDLLAALEAAVADIEQNTVTPSDFKWLYDARAALAKARP